MTWDDRVAAVWRGADALEPVALVAAIDALADERPPGDVMAAFERASARDSAGFEADAEGWYRQALAGEGLDPYRRARATVQLGSTLRLLGRLADSEALLLALLRSHAVPGAPRVLDGEARAFLALTLAAQGRTREAAGIALAALAPHLSRYTGSVARNAAALADGGEPPS